MSDSSEKVKQIYCHDLKKIKKDALYKPLLRKFRNFLRQLMKELNLLKGWQYWEADRLRKRVWSFMVAISLPKMFFTQKHFAMMTLLLFPTMQAKMELDRRYVHELSFHLKDIQGSCHDIFKENNIRKRLQFFQEPLIQFLWGELFTVKQP